MNDDDRRPATQVKFSLRTTFILSTIAGIVVAIGRYALSLLVFLGFLAIVVTVNIMLNMIGVYPKE